jgi:hypothetical protein
MAFSLPQVATRIIVGLAGGTLAGMLLRFAREGFGFFNNPGELKAFATAAARHIARSEFRLS